MEYTPQHVANFMLDKAENDEIPITPLKLVKLVYIAFGWHIALTGKALFDEPIQAWKHGPVIPSIYHEFKHYKNSPISSRSETIDLDTWEAIIPRIPRDDKTANLILSKVWAAYKRFTAWSLREKTHENDGPWSKVYKSGVSGITIKNDDISAHYKKRIAEYINAAKNK